MSAATTVLRRALIAGAVRVGRAVLRRPQLKYAAKTLLATFPSLRTRVQGMMYRAALSSHSRLSNRLKDDAELSPRTIRMLRALNNATRNTDAP
ncbi:hypothetical protein [Massilia sp. PWRC2]|uniref:hypothetical protein n=1 Tax=Massilia sp. PWRC2 TaxID=2804626 RepID=UPI003CF9E083